MVDQGARSSGFTMAEINATKWNWPTLGKYALDKRPGGVTTPHQDFLKTFAYGHWREYSAMAHGSFEGLTLTAMYYVPDTVPHDDRTKIDDTFPRVLAVHIGRAAGVLLCIITELQAYFKFDDSGARINERIHEMWNALRAVFEIRELYEQHYEPLMEQSGIFSS